MEPVRGSISVASFSITFYVPEVVATCQKEQEENVSRTVQLQKHSSTSSTQQDLYLPSISHILCQGEKKKNMSRVIELQKRYQLFPFSNFTLTGLSRA